MLEYYILCHVYHVMHGKMYMLENYVSIVVLVILSSGRIFAVQMIFVTFTLWKGCYRKSKWNICNDVKAD